MLRFIPLLLLILFSPSLWALATDREQPIRITADELEIDESRHINIYRGNVEMRQGSLHIQADSIIFHFTDDNEIEWMEIAGSPAVLNQLNNNDQPVTGKALKMNYFDSRQLIEMMGNAEFTSNQDTINSNQITVNTETDALQAGGSDQNDRVEMLIHPKK